MLCMCKPISLSFRPCSDKAAWASRAVVTSIDESDQFLSSFITKTHATSQAGISPLSIPLTQDIEEEGVNIIVERLVVQEQLGQEAQVLAVDLVLAAVHLKH